MRGWLGIHVRGLTSASAAPHPAVFAFIFHELQGEEAFHCEACKEKTPATKHLRVHRFPEVLVLHIKRFKHKVSVAAACKGLPLESMQSCLH